MRPHLLMTIIAIAGLSTSAGALAAGNAPCGVTTSVSADGVVELSNIENNEQCDATPSVPAAAQNGAQNGAATGEPARGALPAATGDAPASPAADAQSAQGDQAKDPRQNYRDSVLQGAPGTKAAYPSVSRRYKMIDKAAYQAANAGAAQQGAPSAPAAGGAPGQ